MVRSKGGRGGLLELVSSFQADPVAARGGIRELFERDRTEFLRQAVYALLSSAGPGQKYLATLLVSNDLVPQLLVEPGGACSTEAAKWLAGRVAGVDPLLDVKLMQYVWNSPAAGNCEAVLRVLEIIEFISDGTRILPILMQVMRSPDKRLRSKATLLAGRSKRDPWWLAKYLEEEDPRIRANAVEALWGKSTPAVVGLFRKVERDPHPRVIANALVGLYLAGDLDARLLLEQLATVGDASHRRSAAWAMGESGDRVFVPTLQELAGAPESVVRRAALRALVKLNKESAERAGRESGC